MNNYKNKNNDNNNKAQLSTCFSANICLIKFSNKNTRKSCEICSNLTKTPEQCQ